MSTRYFRRYRMEIDLARVALPEPDLPDGYRWIAWDPLLVDRHATVKWESFRAEMDSRVFSCLGEFSGCQRLMREISEQRNFVPTATWLITFDPDPAWLPDDCGTIQGLKRARRLGAIQNVGVVPAQRSQGLGRALVLKSLLGFRAARLKRVYLEVTAQNHAAVDLYQSIGFRVTRTMFKPAQAPDPVGL